MTLIDCVKRVPGGPTRTNRLGSTITVAKAVRLNTKQSNKVTQSFLFMTNPSKIARASGPGFWCSLDGVGFESDVAVVLAVSCTQCVWYAELMESCDCVCCRSFGDSDCICRIAVEDEQIPVAIVNFAPQRSGRSGLAIVVSTLEAATRAAPMTSYLKVSLA